MSHAPQPTTGDNSPWGRIDFHRVLIPGRAIMVETPGHGGIWIDRTTWQAFEQSHPDLIAFTLKWAHGWVGYFEEDCAVSYLAANWPDLIAAMQAQGWSIPTDFEYSPREATS